MNAAGVGNRKFLISDLFCDMSLEENENLPPLSTASTMLEPKTKGVILYKIIKAINLKTYFL